MNGVMSAIGTKQTYACAPHMSAFDPKRTSSPFQRAGAEPLRCIVLSLGGNMRRREFIVGLCGAATMSFAVRAQQPAMPVVGFLRPGSPELNAHLLAAFRKGMGETGYVEGRNVAVEYRWAGNDDRLRELAADLIRLRVNVIVTPGSTTAAAAAKSETTTIPIVFSGGGDPVR